MDEDLLLIYINEVGQDWKGESIYEFLFSDTLDGVDGDDWDEYPASGKPSPPAIQHIYAVGKLKTEFKFELIQNSDTFSVWDSVDGVIALAWEDIREYEESPESRMHFHFGDTLAKVKSVFYEKDIILNVTEVTENERGK